MLDLLKTHFGYDTFLPRQEEIISTVMSGRDSFVLLPTGGGKSLCYQLPALALDGLTLVISPLIALMKDQVDALRANGIPAGFINSSLSPPQISQVQQRVRDGGIKILYVAPERATLPEFQRFLANLNVSLIAIDEAHCVSEWGHEFRPAYRELQSIRQACPNAPVIALTATAPQRVRQDILSQLGLRQPGCFVSSFNRPNLTYAVRPKKDSLPALLDLLQRHRGESAIIYCLSRQSTEDLAQTLRDQGFNAEAYHAGMDPNLRRSVQDRFIRDDVHIVVATIAFGMGIDKPDVRLVVHYDLPKSLEGYYQESGRAGRDGLPSECVLFYSYGDRVKHEFFLNEMEDPQEQERARWRLDQVVKLCNLRACRRNFVLEYLGEEPAAENCGGCDVCLSPTETFDATEIAQKVLSAVVRTGERFGAAHVVNVLLGSRAKQVADRGHDQISVFGIAAGYSQAGLRNIIEDITAEGLLESTGGQYPTLLITPRGRAFLKDRETLTLTRPVQETQAASSRSTGAAPYDPALFHQLSLLRKRLADERNVPAYVIFGNRSLQDIARRAPCTTAEFARVFGVGEAKLNDLSQPFLALINDYVQKHGKPAASSQPQSTILPSPNGPIRQATRETGRIVSSGASLAEAAAQRGILPSTALDQLDQLAKNGTPLKIDHLMPSPARRQEIQNAFAATGGLLLAPVRQLLGEDYSYEELKLVRLGLYQTQPQPAAEPLPPRPLN